MSKPEAILVVEEVASCHQKFEDCRPPDFLQAVTYLLQACKEKREDILGTMSGKPPLEYHRMN